MPSRPIPPKICRLEEESDTDGLLGRDETDHEYTNHSLASSDGWAGTLKAADAELQQLSRSLAKLRDISDSFNLMAHGEPSLLNQMTKLQTEITTLNLENIQLCAQQLQTQANGQCAQLTDGVKEYGALRRNVTWSQRDSVNLISADIPEDAQAILPQASSAMSTQLKVDDEIQSNAEAGDGVSARKTTFLLCKAWRDPVREERGSHPDLRSQLSKSTLNKSMEGNFSGRASMRRTSVVQRPSHSGGEPGARRCCCSIFYQQIALHPAGKRRLAWELLTILMLAWDLVLIPLSAFNPGRSYVIETVNWITISFWTLDVPFSFCTGYFTREDVERSLLKTSLHYMKTWLAFDLAILVMDWIVSVTTFDDEPSRQGGGVGMLVIARRFRFLRVFRLLRLLKLEGIIHDIGEHIRSETLLIFGNIAKYICLIIMASHLIACAWYKLGTWDPDWEQTWVIKHNMVGQDLAYRYSTALHWALTQFTPASMEVVPANSSERFFGVSVVLFAVIAFSTLVSSITNAANQLRNLNKNRVVQNSQLRRFLSEKQISRRLCSCIWGFLEQVRSAKSMSCIHWEEVTVFSFLPRSLQAEVRQQAYMPILGLHSFFYYWNLENQAAINTLLQVAIQEEHANCGQELFHIGDRSEQMYWLVKGQMFYSVTPYTNSLYNSNGVETSVSLDAGQCFCEPPLWIEWRHVGKLYVETAAELICIKAASFQDVMREDFNQCFGRAAKYAGLYAKLANEMDSGQMNDIWMDSDVILGMVLEAFREEDSDGVAQQGEPQRSSWFQGRDDSKPMSSRFAALKPVKFVEGFRGGLFTRRVSRSRSKSQLGTAC